MPTSRPDVFLSRDHAVDPGEGSACGAASRLVESAAGISACRWIERAVLGVLDALSGDVPLRVRLLVSQRGEVTPRPPFVAWVVHCVCLSASPIDDQDPFLYHKTTRRLVYESARRAEAPDADDVLLWK